LFAGQRARCRVFRLDEGPLVFGRLNLIEDGAHDSRISRQHVRIASVATGFQVTDLDSRNGTFVGGERIAGEVHVAAGSLVRVGGVLLLVVADVLPFQRHGLGVSDGFVAGPALRQALDAVAMTQQLGIVPSLLLFGETGAGKEIAAQVFHRAAGKPKAPFVAVNCATIPKDLAERLLFGSRRGAFSGATDAAGHVQAADGGTLFLDEIAELPLEVQSKLLRMLETRQVLRLGATAYEPVDVRVCAATWRDLRQEVAEGRFRKDLYYRIGQPAVRLPPLRERIEEIPWHVQDTLAAIVVDRPLELSESFVEACCSRPWHGNVRELRAEVRRAAATALARGAKSLTADDLQVTAGSPIEASVKPSVRVEIPEDECAAALAAEGGNVARAAKRLGVTRSKVRRWLERHSIDASRFKARP
jgi:DNA-binding NtrC family response regulator